MKFRFVKKVDHPVIGYMGTMLSTGDEIELTGHFIDKAIANPDYEAIQAEAMKKKRAKKKVSRKKVSRRGQD